MAEQKKNGKIKLTPQQYLDFGTRFVDFYIENGFGNKTKRDIDLFVFGTLEQSGQFLGKNRYEVAFDLKISPSKVKTLQVNTALSDGFDVQKYAEQVLICLGSTARKLDEKCISFDIDDPVVQLALKSICVKKQIYKDSSFNCNILSFSLKSYQEIVDVLISGKNKKQFAENLWKNIKDRKWEIKKEELLNSPVIKILAKGAKMMTQNIIEVNEIGSLITNAALATIKATKNTISRLKR